MTVPRRILLGRIVGAQGIKGEVKVQTYTAEPEAIADYGPLSDDSGSRRFEVTVVRGSRSGVVARIAGIADRNGAEALRGIGLYVDRARLPEPEDGAYYHEDLVGLAVEIDDGTRHGRVVSVQNYGAGDLLEIGIEGQRHTELIPFTDAFVPHVDLAAGRVCVVLPTTVDAVPGEDDGDAKPEGGPDTTKMRNSL